MCIRDRNSTEKQKINSITINILSTLQYIKRDLNIDILRHINWLSSLKMRFFFYTIISRIEYLSLIHIFTPLTGYFDLLIGRN